MAKVELQDLPVFTRLVLDDIFTEGDSFLALAVLPEHNSSCISYQESLHPHLLGEALVHCLFSSNLLPNPLLDRRVLSPPIISSFNPIWYSPTGPLLASTLRAAEVLLTC